jgi:hypothetical protein
MNKISQGNFHHCYKGRSMRTLFFLGFFTFSSMALGSAKMSMTVEPLRESANAIFHFHQLEARVDFGLYQLAPAPCA